MLEKSMYDSWASRIRLFIKGKKHAEQLQDDCDVQATNIILHGLPPNVYALVNHQEAAKDIWDRGEILYEYYWRFSQLINDMYTIGMTMQQVQVNTKFLNALPSEWSKFVTDVKLAKSLYTTNYDQLYAYLSQHEQHANEVRITRERYPDSLALVANSQTLYNPSQFPQHSGSPIKEKIRLNALTSNGISVCYSIKVSTIKNQLRTSSNPKNQATIQDGIATTSKGNYAAGQPRVVKCYNCQGEGHMARQCTQLKRPRNTTWFKEKLMLAEAQEAGQILDEEQLAFLEDPGIDEAPVDTNSSAPNDLLVLSLVEQMNDHASNLDKQNETYIMVNESLTAELERYKERVAIFEQRQNVDLNKREKLIDSQMGDLIQKRNAKFAAFQQEIDTLKETLSNNVKEKESLSTTLTRIKPTLYDGSVIAKEHAVISVNDDEEILTLEEESRSKMLNKQNDPISIEKKFNISLINYSKLNKLKEDFGKRFVTKKELDAEQAFWLKHSNQLFVTLVNSPTPIRIKAPSELPKVSLVNESLKRLKFQLANFDKVVKNKTTFDAITTRAWGFEHTKACFQTEIIPFIKLLKDTFNAFDKTLLDEITEV
ncbi:retrovirus-related pol polyprotein from transposon TNT 1-94 [Tanacetum coccineum]